MNLKTAALFAWFMFEASRRAVFEGCFFAGDALMAAGRWAKMLRVPWVARGLFRAAKRMFKLGRHITAVGDVAVTYMEDF